jgi:AraC family transcriptional regulator of adaptative response/methylated-DNA-[protein]-cysteine methyltransferase
MDPVTALDSTAATEYRRVADALSYISEHRRSQPTLYQVAAHVGLSEHHFQRLFQRWAGVSPKKFLQFLTVEHAKRLLTSDFSVLDASLDVGLSGPGRLHDLFVTVEGMSPGEFKRAGEGLSISRDLIDTPFGPALLSRTTRGVCGLAFVGEGGVQSLFQEQAERWPGARFNSDPAGADTLARRMFRTDTTSSVGELRLLLSGTRFQLKVWEALLSIPPGRLTTYGGLAQALGRPVGAARAVGQAVGANPVAYLIPCHRVIRGSGELGGYRWGLARKRAILGWETAKLPNLEVS